ncbi:MAG: ribonuclease D, partial [Pseudomonadota bacterium]
QPFLDLLKNTNVVKVFHAARQDLEIFYRLLGEVPRPLFDSQIAAMACGFGDQIGYEPLMRALVGAKIDKGSRFTDWSRRPLTDAQLDYAMSDVTHLRAAYPILLGKLERDNRSRWVQEELEALYEPSLYFIAPEEAWRRIKLRNAKPAMLGPLMKLAEWRENEAQSRNVPRGRIMKDDALLDLARLAPKDATALASARSVPRGFEKSKSAAGLLDAVAAGAAMPSSDLPVIADGRDKRNAPPDVVDLLKVLLKRQCEAHQVAPKLIASTNDLEEIALNDNADVPAMKGWRRDVFGEQALQLKRGEAALKLSGRRVEIVPLS